MPQARRTSKRWIFAASCCIAMATLYAPSARAQSRRSKTMLLRSKALQGVRMEDRLEFLLPKGTADPLVYTLPEGLGLEVDLPLAPATIRNITAKLPPHYRVDLQTLATGQRLRITSPGLSMQSRVGYEKRRGRKYIIIVGIDSEEQKLREFAETIRLPLPQPRQLGAQLELWQEAEQRTYKKQVLRARRIWDKLSEQKHLLDLCELRRAELFIITGHVNEAIQRLRTISANYPRSVGASLSRLDALHLEIVIGEGRPNAEQIIIAAQAGSQSRFRAIANFRAAHALGELGREDLALTHLPELLDLSSAWKGPATALERKLTARAILSPLLQDQISLGIASFHAWKPRLAKHPQRIHLIRHIADALLELGLYGESVELLREQLEKFPPPNEEARLVSQLATAYHGTEALDHELAAIQFLLENHPSTPKLDQQVRSLLLQRHRKEGFASMERIGPDLAQKSPSPAIDAEIFYTLADVARAEGQLQKALSWLESAKAAGPTPKLRRLAEHALLSARLRPTKASTTLLRKVIGKITAPELHDELAYQLAENEFQLGRRKQALRILDQLSEKGSQWGYVARARRRQLALQDVVDNLQKHRNRPRP